MATPQMPPLPPDIQAQEQPEAAQSVFAQQGADKPQPGMELMQAAAKKFQELDKWLGETRQVLQSINPSFVPAFLGPIANSGQDALKALGEMAQRSGLARGSPVTQQQPTMNPSAGPPTAGAM